MSAVPASHDTSTFFSPRKVTSFVNPMNGSGKIIPFPFQKSGMKTVAQAKGDPALSRASLRELNAALKAAFEEEAHRQ